MIDFTQFLVCDIRPSLTGFVLCMTRKVSKIVDIRIGAKDVGGVVQQICFTGCSFVQLETDLIGQGPDD